MEKPLKINTRPIYILSLFIVFVFIFSIGSTIAFMMNYMWGLNLNATGCWVTCLGIFLFGTTSWTNPDIRVGWGATGIDDHPKKENAVLSSYECKQYAIWQQPNKFKLTITVFVFFTGALFQALGSTFKFLA